ncbi:MAG: glucose-6-phosphate isomerase [Eubacteriales bacterium]|nr:glucose-6-phosphate isomerase [Eubacteriales bacterium]
MAKLTFDFNNATAGMVGDHGFTEEEIAKANDMLAGAHRAVNGRQMGFRLLPNGQEDILQDIIDTGASIRSAYDNFVVLGIGGSALGPISVGHALSYGRHGINFFVEDNVDPERLTRLFDTIDIGRTMFNVITKSGKTSETMAQLMCVADRLQKKGLALREHIVATTDEKNGNLIRIAKEEHLKTFVIPAGVGGRFSELCPVGLLPAAVCGLDIRAMLAGAAYMDAVCGREENNPAALYALLHVLGISKGINISVMMPYADSLKYMADWYAQLWAESLGKRFDRDGREVNTGQTPVGALGVTDQHSQIQLYTEGPYDKIITFLKVGSFRCDLDIPAAFPYVEDIAYLGGKTFGALLEAERSATEYALLRAGRPNITITMDDVSEYTVGALLHFFEMATAYAGEMLGIDAFDQPGVEEGKLATFALMGKSGFEEKKAEMDAQTPKKSEWIIE